MRYLVEMTILIFGFSTQKTWVVWITGKITQKFGLQWMHLWKLSYYIIVEVRTHYSAFNHHLLCTQHFIITFNHVTMTFWSLHIYFTINFVQLCWHFKQMSISIYCILTEFGKANIWQFNKNLAISKIIWQNESSMLHMHEARHEVQ